MTKMRSGLADVCRTPPTSPSAADRVSSLLIISTDEGLIHFTHDEDFLLAAIQHVENVAVPEAQVLAAVSEVINGFQVDFVNFAVAGDIDAALVGVVRQPARQVNGIDHGHRQVIHWQHAGYIDLADDIDPLAAKVDDAHIELRIVNVAGQVPRSDEFSQLSDGLTVRPSATTTPI